MAIKPIKASQIAAKVAKKAGIQPSKAQKVIDALIEVIEEELRVSHICQIKNFATFTAKQWGGYVDKLGRLTPLRWVTTVRFSKNFKNAVNGIIWVPGKKPKEIKGKHGTPVSRMDKRNYRQVDEVQSMIKHMAETGESVASQMEKRKERLREERQKK